MLPLLLLSLGASQPPANPYGAAPVFAEPRRLELSPMLDGKIDPEEWDELYEANGMTAYMQYEPGRYHFAATLPQGQDLVISLDQKSDGWLHGDDNLEVRVHLQDGKPQVHVRRLDATKKAGPEWVDEPGFSLSCQAAAGMTGNGDTAGETAQTIELTLIDDGIGLVAPNPGDKPSLRFDAVPADSPMAEAYLPRVLSPVQLQIDRGTALPDALKWGTETKARGGVPGEGFKIRLTFNGSNDLGAKRIAFRGEGYAKDACNLIEKPFPEFDNKKRAFVDYDSNFPKGSPTGYRLLRSTLSFDKGPECVMESSFRIAPPLDIDMTPLKLKAGQVPQDARLIFYLKSNCSGHVVGNFKVDMPGDFSMKDSSGDFSIRDYHGSLRRVVPLIITKIAPGTYPIHFTGSANGQPFDWTEWVTVE